MAYTSQEPVFFNISISDGNLDLPLSTGFQGQITIGNQPFMHSIGTFNTFLGTNAAGNFTVTGAGNCGIGNVSMQQLTTGGNNSGLGYNSLTSLTTGASNVAIGAAVLGGLLTGNNNIGIGASITNGAAGHVYTSSESSNIVIGNVGVLGESGVIRIGDVNQTKCFIAGIFGVTVGVSGTPVVVDNAGNLGTVVSSRRLKENIKYLSNTSSVLNLKPVSFHYKSDESKTNHFGLIAEEVHESMPELVSYDHNNQPFSVQYHELPVLLLNEIKKLHAQVSTLEIAVKTLKERLL
jgi:hypothetical protein